ncbi:unknown [Sutterella sp. CAG:351]|nr:unknown [Sutterella sp. CAG:351]
MTVNKGDQQRDRLTEEIPPQTLDETLPQLRAEPPLHGLQNAVEDRESGKERENPEETPLSLPRDDIDRMTLKRRDDQRAGGSHQHHRENHGEQHLLVAKELQKPDQGFTAVLRFLMLSEPGTPARAARILLFHLTPSPTERPRFPDTRRSSEEAHREFRLRLSVPSQAR